MKKTLIILVFALAFAGKCNPVIFKTFTYPDIDTGRIYFVAHATNLELGTIWEYQVKTNLECTNWVHWGSQFYIGQGTNSPIPYVLTSWPMDSAPRAFFRMNQVGTNYQFYGQP